MQGVTMETNNYDRDAIPRAVPPRGSAWESEKLRDGLQGAGQCSQMHWGVALKH